MSHVQRPGTTGRPIPVTEWIVAATGAVLVAGTIGYLVYLALSRDEGPPDLRITAAGVVELPDGWLVRFRAVNAGAQAAVQLQVEGVLAGPDGAIETAEATIDYLPPRSEREGGLIFSRDPRRHELRLRAEGYALP
ncbi:MAG TPA: TIGR02588 family protein [Geminicoccaceae bacterium]|nr:TIGR02588 family protein [Geminicoccaceae bacterium]